MIRRIMAEVDVVNNLRIVRENIKASFLKRPPGSTSKEPRLVAVSKTKPKQLIIAAYNSGQRNFGENYVQELVEKSYDPEILDQCPEIRWHLIGHVQRNKVNKVAQIPNLYMVESIDSEKLAAALDQACLKTERTADSPLLVMVQVNTSGEDAKSGCKPSEAANLFRFIMDKCPNLRVIGLMTIGQYGYDVSQGPNPDFKRLVDCQKEVCKVLGKAESDLELSMGMSTDYEHAIEVGSSNVRVGSTIFGQRDIKS